MELKDIRQGLEHNEFVFESDALAYLQNKEYCVPLVIKFDTTSGDVERITNPQTKELFLASQMDANEWKRIEKIIDERLYSQAY